MAKREILMLNGYRCVYEPNHPRAMHGNAYEGYVYEHIFVVEKYLGRALHKDEEVHHLDENRANNQHRNLLVLLKSQHPKIHGWIKAGCPNSDSEWSRLKICKTCNRTIQDPRYKEYCCSECYKDDRPSKIPPKKQLQNDIKTMTWMAMGRKYGVTDNSVRKWARKYKLIA